MTDLIANQFNEGASDADTLETNTDLQFSAMRSVIGELFTALSQRRSRPGRPRPCRRTHAPRSVYFARCR